MDGVGSRIPGITGQKGWTESLESAQMRSSNSAPRHKHMVVQLANFYVGNDSQADIRPRRGDPNQTSPVEINGVEISNGRGGVSKPKPTISDTSARIQKFRMNQR